MQFHKYPTRRQRNMFQYALYTSVDRQFAVERSKWLGRVKMPVRFRALKRVEGLNSEFLWFVISTHRTKRAAERAVHKQAKSARNRDVQTQNR